MVFINFHTKVNLVSDALKDNQNFDGLLEHVAEVLNNVKYLCKQTMIEWFSILFPALLWNT